MMRVLFVDDERFVLEATCTGVDARQKCAFRSMQLSEIALLEPP
jgi:hypothetical protein